MGGKTVVEFLFSALWHGFYPGLYFTFLTGAFLTYTNRLLRQVVGPFFVGNKVLATVYAVAGWLVSHFSCNYAVTPMLLKDFSRTIEFNNSWYWFIQTSSILISIVFMFLNKAKKRAQKKID